MGTMGESVVSHCFINTYTFHATENESLERFPCMLPGCCLLFTFGRGERLTTLPALGARFDTCSETVLCEDPNSFCGTKLEMISSWFVGCRCYPKKTAGWLCNSPSVCLSGVCKMLALNFGYCSA